MQVGKQGSEEGLSDNLSVPASSPVESPAKQRCHTGLAVCGHMAWHVLISSPLCKRQLSCSLPETKAMLCVIPKFLHFGPCSLLPCLLPKWLSLSCCLFDLCSVWSLAHADSMHISDTLLVQVLASGLANATLVRSACSLLRQLANSDAIKAEIVDAGGLELLCRAVNAHTPHAGRELPSSLSPAAVHIPPCPLYPPCC